MLRIGYPLYVIFFCVLSASLLTFCSDDDSITQDDNSGTATPSPTPTPSTSPSQTEPQNGENGLEYVFTPATITAGLPFTFSLKTPEGKPYLLSLASCGEALLLHGQWPKTEYATTYIEGTDSKNLNNLVIINTNGKPTIDASCQLKATVGQGTDDEESTLIGLKTKAGAITLSNASIIGDKVKLDAADVANGNSIILVGKKETIMHGGKEYQRYRPVAISNPLGQVPNGKETTKDLQLYKPTVKFPPDVLPSDFATGDYLVSVANIEIRTPIEQSVLLQATAIKVSVP